MTRVVRAAHISVSELTLRKTAIRILGQKLVSTEVDYVQRTLGSSATQDEIDQQVVAVRKLPWASIVQPE